MSRMKTTEEFIADARKIHGDKYDYSKVEYKGNKKDVCIICPTHGDFPQTPLNHLHGHGCPKCSGKHHYTNEEWINLAKKVHGDKYDYSKTNYVNNYTQVKIICPIHGVFEKYPPDHINGDGCQKCSREIQSKNQTLTKEEFISRARKVHGDKYTYDNVEYIDSHTDVLITCPIHGNFQQMPNTHLNGYGCSKCNESKLETEIFNLLNEKNIEFEQGYHVKWLGLQHLDFYLPQYNIAIECQGEQHYELTRFGGVKDKKLLEENFKLQQQRDQRKKQLCEEHGVKLLYFTHYKDVEESEILFKTKEKLLFFIKENENNLTR